MGNLFLANGYLYLEHSSLEYTMVPALISFRFIVKHHLITEAFLVFDNIKKKKNVSNLTLPIPLSFFIFLQNAHHPVIYIIYISSPLAHESKDFALFMAVTNAWNIESAQLSRGWINDLLFFIEYLLLGPFTNNKS